MDDFVSDDEEYGSMKKSDSAESGKLADEEKCFRF